MKVLYRMVDMLYAGPPDEWGDPIPNSGSLGVSFRTYRILKETKCGVWIEYWGNPSQKKFVNLQCNKKFGCLTMEEAIESFKARKLCQIEILTRQLERARKARKLASDVARDPKRMEEAKAHAQFDLIGW
jgi:hypothetical protein